MSKKCQIVLGTTAMQITPEPVASNTVELIAKTNIESVHPIGPNFKPTTAEDAPWWIYPYPSQTSIDVVMRNGHRMNIELQDITNQPTWSTGNLAGIQAAMADINAWL